MKYTDERMIPELSESNTFWEHIHRYSFAAEWVKGKRVLDIASGEGYGSDSLRRAGAGYVVGVEIDPEACAHAAEKYEIDVRVGSAESIPLPESSVDVVVSFETIEHVARPRVFVDEVWRVLSPGGVFIVSTPDTRFYSPHGERHNPYHCSEMGRSEFESILRFRFDRVVLFGQRPQLSRWWSPVALIAEGSPWDRVPFAARLRRKVWARANPQRLGQLSEIDRRQPGERVLRARRGRILRFFDWSSVRRLWPTNGWSPVFLVAVARKVG